MDINFQKEWVAPFYMGVLHGNCARGLWDPEEQAAFALRAQQQLKKVTANVISQLLAGYWREAIVGSWFAGLARQMECRDEIGELLVASKTCFAGQAHAFALACFADERSAQYLVEYLDIYLRKLDCIYDQNWAMPALVWVDETLGTSHAKPFLVKDGLWETFIAGCGVTTESWQLDNSKSRLNRCMLFCEEQIRTSTTPKSE